MEVWIPVTKRFLHLCPHNWSIEPGTGACNLRHSSILELRIDDISYSGSPSMMTGGSEMEFRPGKEFGVTGSIMEMWNTG